MKLEAKQRLTASKKDSPEQYMKDGANLLKLLAKTRYGEKMGRVEVHEGYEDDPDDYIPGFSISGYATARSWTSDDLKHIKLELGAELAAWLKKHTNYTATLWAKSSAYWTISVYEKQ